MQEDAADADADGEAAEVGSDETETFCANADEIGDDVVLMQQTEYDDPPGYADQIRGAAERFTGIEPPEQIAAEWQSVSDLLTLADEALRDVEVRTEEDITAALQFDDQTPEAFAKFLQLPGQVEVVSLYLQDNCQVDLGVTPPAIADVCAAVDVVHLGSVFDGAAPAGENRRWGGATVECLWSDDDRDVGIVVMPADIMHSDILGGTSPLDGETAHMGDAAVEIYDGAYGPFRQSSGRTAATLVGDTGVVVSLSGGDDSRADTDKAIALVGFVIDGLI